MKLCERKISRTTTIKKALVLGSMKAITKTNETNEDGGSSRRTLRVRTRLSMENEDAVEGDGSQEGILTQSDGSDEMMTRSTKNKMVVKVLTVMG